LSFQGGTTMDEVERAVRSGNAAQLSKFFDNNVDLTLPDKSDTYSNRQAETIMRDFFSNYGVRSFEVKHKGGSAGSKFFIGDLTTKNGGTLRVTCYLKDKGDKQVLQKITVQ
jgi:Domain of unknown function (DUF4783)